MATGTSPRWTAKYWAERIGRYGKLEQMTLPVEKDDSPTLDELYTLKLLRKHLQGTHDQLTHGHGDGGTEEPAAKESKRSVVAEQTPTERTKSEIAKASATRVGAEIQRYCEENNEASLAKALGGKAIPDNAPTDVETTIDGTSHGIELKTMVSNKASKLTMKKEAQDRKRSWERKNKGKMHTVVFDDREVFNAKGPGKHDESKRKILYRRGFGSFRTDRMYEVKGGMKELKQLLSMDKRKLPKGAKSWGIR